MLFPSVIFLAFFAPLFLLCYFILPWRNVTFFLFSLAFFYWGENKYIGVLLGFIAINYLFGLLVGRATLPVRRKLFLGLGIAANCLLLFYYKYFTFAVTKILPDFLGIHVSNVHLPHLPLGISYFTFHGISYLIDVYRGVSVYSKSVLNVALYISMFPHMVAGPIVRYHTIAKALIKRYITFNRIAFSLRLFVIGLAQKTLIANNLGAVSDKIFGLPKEALDGITAWAGTLAYTLQIYFDFCGYSFMAIAIGIILGFRLPRNFRYPYFSQSITEFWRRWHISLSTWFRDYLYIPLGGNRNGHTRTLVNLFTVFFLCGLWHGAAYTFVAWGIFHGLLLIVERLGWRKILKKLPRIVRHIYTMLAVMIGWVLFRSDGINQALHFLSAMTGLTTVDTASTLAQIITHEQQISFFLGLLFATPLVEVMSKKLFGIFGTFRGTAAAFLWVLSAWRAVSLVALFILSYMYVLAGTYSPFLYFRF
jgi:alginate O-acetyltransferase complex protein AlgI